MKHRNLQVAPRGGQSMLSHNATTKRLLAKPNRLVMLKIGSPTNNTECRVEYLQTSYIHCHIHCLLGVLLWPALSDHDQEPKRLRYC